MKFLNAITLVVLLFLSLAVVVSAAPNYSDLGYEKCFTLEASQGKHLELDYIRVHVLVKRIYNEEAYLDIKFVNRVFIANHLKVGDNYGLPDNWDLVVQRFDTRGDDRVEFCFIKVDEIVDMIEIVQDTKVDVISVEDIKNDEVIDNEIDTNKDELDETELELQSPKSTTKDYIIEVISSVFSHRYYNLF